jgi:methionyl aminopeptidase
MIHKKTPEEIALMAEGGAKLRAVTEQLTEAVKEGVRLKELDILAERLMREAGGEPAFLGYKPAWAEKPYPASICASVNDVVVHGIPSAYKLKSGDIIKLDLGLKYKGFYTDTAVTVGVGEISDEAKQIIAVTKDSLTLAIDQCIVGNTVGDIGFAVNSYVRKHGMRVVKGLTGHGIGRHLHEDPVVANEAKPSMGVKLTAGMVIAIEPMVTLGSGETIQLKLDESFATKERVLAAHFEHTIAITDAGPQVLT